MPSVRLGSNAAPSSLKIQYRSHARTSLDFCLRIALKNTGHGSNVVGIQEVLPMVHKARRVPYGFGALWHGVLLKRPNYPIPDGPEFGRPIKTGRYGRIEISAILVGKILRADGRADNE